MVNDKTQHEVMQKESFTDALLNQLGHFTTDQILSHDDFSRLKIHHEQQFFLFSENCLIQLCNRPNIQRKSCQQINEQDDHDLI